MKSLLLTIKRVTVVRGSGTDRISFCIEAPTSFPEMNYESYLTAETRHGYAEEWLAKLGITEFELIKTR